MVLVDFYDHGSSTPATVVNLWPGSGRSDAGNWHVSDTPQVSAHEVGHLMGFYDEYGPDGGWGPNPPWQRNHPGHLMCDLGGSLADYYFSAYATWLGGGARTGEPWSIVSYA